jgi:hypothetical protein
VNVAIIIQNLYQGGMTTGDELRGHPNVTLGISSQNVEWPSEYVFLQPSAIFDNHQVLEL